jgi:hypothetical protein
MKKSIFYPPHHPSLKVGGGGLLAVGSLLYPKVQEKDHKVA